MTEITSAASTGEQFPLPTSQDEAAELQRLQALVVDHRAQNHKIVVVMGVGFVGAVMAGVIADSVRKGTDFKSVPNALPLQVRHRYAAPIPPILLENPAVEPGKSIKTISPRL